MKKLIVATLVLGLVVGCSKQEETKEDVVHPTVTEEVKSESTSNANADITPKEAKAFAEQLYNKIVKDQQFLEDAFELKEYDILSKYIITDWAAYANAPHQYAPRALSKGGFVYYPSSEVMYPYSVCDTAYSDLNIYAGTMEMLLREDTANLRQIMRQEKEDYEKSVAKCKHRVELPYSEALAEDNAE